MAKKPIVTKREKIITMLGKGISYDTIAIKVDCSLSYVKTIEKQIGRKKEVKSPEIFEPNYLIKSEKVKEEKVNADKMEAAITVGDVKPAEAPQRHFCSVFPETYADVYAIVTHPSGKVSKAYLCDKALEEIRAKEGVVIEVMPIM